MEAKNSKLEYFDIKNLPLVVDVVVPLWSPPIGDKEFKRFNVEYIVRMNMFDNDLNYQLVDADDGTLLSSAFLAKKEMRARLTNGLLKRQKNILTI